MSDKIITLDNLAIFKDKIEDEIDSKQDTLATQTAYTSKGSSTKVPQITTNTLGQVTNITEVDITDTGIEDYEVIVKENTLPTAAEGTPDFVQLPSGVLYRKKIVTEDPATITDLSGTTWVIKNTRPPVSNFEYNVNFVSNSTNYSKIKLYENSEEMDQLQLQYDNTRVGEWYPGPGISNVAYRTLSFIDGIDITNTNFIAWLQAQADLQARTFYTYDVVDTDTDTDTWRQVKVNGTEILGTGTNTNPLDLKAGANVTLSNNNGEVTIAATDTTYDLATTGTAGLVKSATTGTAANRDYNVEVNNDGTMKVNVPWTDTDVGATSIETTGNGNVVSSGNYDATTRKITLTKDVTALTTHQSIKSLDTTATTAQTTSANEDIAGSGTVTLHKVAKTGTYSDLIGTPTLGTAAAKDFTTSVTSGSADLVTSGAVYTAIDNLPEPMVFKGTLGATGATITTLPAASAENEGFTYKVITDGTYAGTAAKVGDVFTSNGTDWVLIPAGDDIEDTWRNIQVDGVELLGSGISSGAVNFKSGANVTITGSGNDITIAATDTTYSDATTSASGLMSAADKTKLEGIEAGAQVNPSAYIKGASASGNTLTLTKQDDSEVAFTPTFTEQHLGDVVSVGATSGSNIAIGGTSANPTVGVATGYSIPSDAQQSTWTGKISDSEVINRPNEMPTANETSPDFVEYNNNLYKKVKHVTTNVTDLTLTRWTINSTTCSAGYGHFDVQVAINTIGTYPFTLYLGYTVVFDGTQDQLNAQADSVCAFGTDDIGNIGDIITVGDILDLGYGTDVTNPDLIAWLEANATIAPTYSYELVDNEIPVLSNLSLQTNLTDEQYNILLNHDVVRMPNIHGYGQLNSYFIKIIDNASEMEFANPFICSVAESYDGSNAGILDGARIATVRISKTTKYFDEGDVTRADLFHTITITLAQVISQNPITVQLTSDQHDKFSWCHQVIIDATDLGMGSVMAHLMYIGNDLVGVTDFSPDGGYYGLEFSEVEENDNTTYYMTVTPHQFIVDNVIAEEINSESTTAGYVLTADGQGGASWQPSQGGGSGIVDSSLIESQITVELTPSDVDLTGATSSQVDLTSSGQTKVLPLFQKARELLSNDKLGLMHIQENAADLSANYPLIYVSGSTTLNIYENFQIVGFENSDLALGTDVINGSEVNMITQLLGNDIPLTITVTFYKQSIKTASGGSQEYYDIEVADVSDNKAKISISKETFDAYIEEMNQVGEALGQATGNTWTDISTIDELKDVFDDLKGDAQLSYACDLAMNLLVKYAYLSGENPVLQTSTIYSSVSSLADYVLLNNYLGNIVSINDTASPLDVMSWFKTNPLDTAQIISIDQDATFTYTEREEQGGAGGISTMQVELTYSEFVSAISNSQLIPGMNYRITDYVTKIHGVYDLSIIGQTGAYLPYATSAEHPFDIIVTATGTNTYNENVKAIQHDGDTYFAHSNLASWEVKWTHKNDASQYSYADETNGKGVIYYMKDEFDNEAFFDFKNVMNLQLALRRVDSEDEKGISFEYDASTQPNRYGTLFDVFQVLQGHNIGNNLEFDVEDINGTSAIMLLTAITDVSKNTLDATMDWTYMLAVLSSMMETTVTLAMLAQLLGTTEQILAAMTERQVIQTFFNGDFYYTFNLNLDGTFYDFTSYYNYDSGEDVETYGGAYCWSNHLGKNPDLLTSYLDAVTTIPNGISLITFENTSIYHNYGNDFGENSMLNVFGHNCICNTMGDMFWDNRIANQFDQNTFGNYCNSNSFGNGCYSNSFGNYCNSNSFGNGCYSNSFGNGCNSNSFGNYCYSNSFGNYCNSNSFGNYCYSNSFGNYCDSNSFGNGCYSNSFGNYCDSNSFGNGCDSNSFGNYCYSNSFGNGCYSNSFGNGCYSNKLGEGTSSNQTEDCISKNIFENGVSYIYLTSSTTGAYNNVLQNVKICQGVHGTDGNNRLTITATRNLDYQVEYKAAGSTEIILGGNN